MTASAFRGDSAVSRTNVGRCPMKRRPPARMSHCRLLADLVNIRIAVEWHAPTEDVQCGSQHRHAGHERTRSIADSKSSMIALDRPWNAQSPREHCRGERTMNPRQQIAEAAELRPEPASRTRRAALPSPRAAAANTAPESSAGSRPVWTAILERIGGESASGGR